MLIQENVGKGFYYLEWVVAGFMVALPPYFFFDQLPIILDNQPGFRLSLGSFANIFLSISLFFIRLQYRLPQIY